MQKPVPERSEMFATWCFPVLLGVLALGACAVAPPQGPAVVALPPEGKNLAQFQQEDATCRGYAQQQLGHGAPQQPADAGVPVNAGASAAELQQRYDIAYAQCMAASGNSLQQFPMAWRYGPYSYAYLNPGFYNPWFFPPVSLGFFGGFGPGFRHDHSGFEHGGFHHG
jgi:hypothetical protein